MGALKAPVPKYIQYKIPRANSSDAVNDTRRKQIGVKINKLFII